MKTPRDVRARNLQLEAIAEQRLQEIKVLRVERDILHNKLASATSRIEILRKKLRLANQSMRRIARIALRQPEEPPKERAVGE